MTPNLDRTFSALSDPTRRGVIELLRKEPRRASDLADVLGASKPAMSRHLRVLRASGLVDTSSEGDARERIYRLRPDPFKQLRHWLELVEQFWMLQLDSFKEHVERKGRDDRQAKPK
jgi:DNA-binding transcriptional ArsR family regulator